MKKYKFYDTDTTGWEEYDISGENFKELIRACGKYCKTLSLRITGPEVLFVEELDAYCVPKDKNITYVYEHYYYGLTAENQPDVKYYRVCPELCALLPRIADSIFKWINGWEYTNPEDPVFYRADGSLFFSSTIHEGECILTPREGEDVSSVISQEHWIEINE